MASYSSGRRRAIVLLLLTSILLITLDLRGSAVFDAAREGFSEVLEPVESAAEVVTRPVRHAWRGITNYDDLEEENRRLRETIDAQRGAEITNNAFILEHQQLLEIDDLPSLADLPSVAATVVGESPTNLDQVIEIDRGSSSGIEVGMAVLNNAGLVGKITEVRDDRSLVMLVTDEDYAVGVKVLGIPPPTTTTTTTTTVVPGSTVPGEGVTSEPGLGPTTAPPSSTPPSTGPTSTAPSSIEPGAATTTPAATTTSTTAPPELRERETGVLTGRGRGKLPQVGLLVDDPTVGLIEEGDVVMTAGGDDGLAPPGIPVGEVENVVRRSSSDGPLLEVALAADLARLYFVRIVLYQPGANSSAAGS